MTGGQTISRLLHRTASRHPLKCAVRSGEIACSYADFSALCERLAAGLIHEAVVTGSRVAALSRNSHACAALRACAYRRGPCPHQLHADGGKSGLDPAPRWRACARARPRLGRTRAQRRFAEHPVEKLLALPGESSPEIEGEDMLGFARLAATTVALPEISVVGTDPAQIVYTSSTESLPKRAMLAHEAVIWQ